MSNIFLSTTFSKDNEKLSDILSKISKYNIINKIELGSNHKYQKNYKFISKYNFDLLTHNYFPPLKKDFVINIASKDNLIRKKSINVIKKNIKFSKSIASKLYTFHPGFIEDPISKNIGNKNYDFVWEKKLINRKNYELSWKLMISSIKEIIKYSKKINQKIAFETEGSLDKKHLLLMQKPNEFDNFSKEVSFLDIGINLNLGHLNLASKAFNFSRSKFIKKIKKYVVAIEMSHNFRKKDDHLPLKKNAWYWKILNDNYFKNVFKILEVRNTSLVNLKKNLKIINDQIKY